MQIIKTSQILTPAMLLIKKEGKKVGFVPTMGALHEGHVSLMRMAKMGNDVLVVSIFVNPAQFNDPNDLAKYPRPIENDISLLEQAGCDILYLPEVDDVYPVGMEATRFVKNPTGVVFNFGGLEKRLEGASRPGHFAGVAQVVNILLQTVLPDVLYLGQKDYQQFLILKKMVEFLDLKLQVIRCPIIRENNGLAMSSRNVRLSDELRIKAGGIYATLNYAASLLHVLPIAEIETSCLDALNALDDFVVDYFEILDADTLDEAQAATQQLVIITSVIVGGVRLLDNLVVEKITPF
ncbi:MAG: pantoate--beta-alanine ligase [Chitinophagales bacterium]